MFKICLVAIGLLCFLSDGALAASPITLEGAIRIALDNNADLKAKEAAIDAAKGTRLKLSAFLPSGTRLGLQGASDFVFQNEGQYRVEARVSQEFEIAGQLTLRKQIGCYEVEKAERDFEWSKSLLIFEIKTEFYRLLYLEKKEQIDRNLADSNRKLARLAAKRQKERILTQFDSDLWHFEDVDSSASLLTTMSQMNEARFRLAKLIGGGSIVEQVDGKWPDAFSLPPVDDVVALALANRADLIRLQFEVKQRLSLYDLAKRSWVPNPEVSLIFDHERSVSPQNGSNSLSNRDSFLGLGISVPLPFFIGKSGDVNKASAERRIAAFEKSALETQIVRDVKNFYQQFELANETMSLYRGFDEKLDANLKLLSNAYQKGNIDFATFLNYRDRLIKAQLRYAEAQWTRAQSWNALQLASATILGDVK